MSITLPTIDALGTTWWIEVFEELDDKRCAVIYTDIRAFLSTFEARYSRFKADSSIGILNRTGTIPHPDAELRELLTFGISQYERTDGIFNLMVGSALVESGYDATYSFTASDTRTAIPTPEEALAVSDQAIVLTRGQVDFGGFGKGWAIDVIARLLREKHHLSYFLINGGGDMFATSDNDTPITIYLEHPTETNSYLAETTLHTQGFAASSPHKRAWTHAGKTYTHIIDTIGVPRADRPDATFVKAATACTADIFATVALLATPVQLEKFAADEELGLARFFIETGTLEQNAAFI